MIIQTPVNQPDQIAYPSKQVSSINTAQIHRKMDLERPTTPNHIVSVQQYLLECEKIMKPKIKCTLPSSMNERKWENGGSLDSNYFVHQVLRLTRNGLVT